jgi:hypothetical protein
MTQTLDTTTAARPTVLGRLTAARAQARTRRADRFQLARQITAYPAARGVFMGVLPERSLTPPFADAPVR